ncbi:MAG: glycosyltransferase family 39 protein [Flavobacteriaceae bacterium]|nr:glycosyltransferase family 39 protein [Flavobacteriaceae bacterium]MDH3795711.1 glycosyltransferase family 39 protein [Flavobacteriaceae bacterium]
MIPERRYWLLLALSVLVYIAGLFVTLFENDSAQFAVMAMRMAQENDFINLIKDSQDYLDKPHLHFWLAALSFKIFGIHDWAYRLPGLIFTLMAAYSTYGLGRLLYNKEIGRLAALIFMSCQTIVLSAIDVRTDAVLTGSVILAIWQLAIYLQNGHLRALLLGAFATGLAFSTKGQIGLLVIGIPLLCHVIYQGYWKRVIHPKVLLAVLVFGLTISPMLYAYYQQFDMHPEKVIRGLSDRSGIRFIFWEQSFERLSGEGVGKNSSDYFFFFHTLLWVLIPWTFLSLFALFTRIKIAWKTRLHKTKSLEILTLGGILIVFLIISFAQFKLPHYLNVLMPLFAVITSAYIAQLYQIQKTKQIRINLGLQFFILGLFFLAAILICFTVFKFEHWYWYVILLVLFLPVAHFCLERNDYTLRLITITVAGSVMFNLVMNIHFYPRLLNFQGGSTMASWVKQKDMDTSRIFKASPRHTWAMDFYLQDPLLKLNVNQMKAKKDIWVYADERELSAMREAGIQWDRQQRVDQFRITRLQAKFLKPATRMQVVRNMYLVHLP